LRHSQGKIVDMTFLGERFVATLVGV
jgi:hypothetical protein